MSVIKTEKAARVVTCPTCKKQVQWTKAQKYRPFCSERCKLIDLGDWASEGHRILGEQLATHHLDSDDNSSDY